MSKVKAVVSRSLYEAFVEQEAAGVPLYYYPWWLDAACGSSKKWIPWCAVDANEEPLAIFPLYMPIRGVALHPPYTQTGGLLIRQNYDALQGDRMAHRRFTLEREICTLMEQAMPRFSFFQVPFSYRFKDMLPYHWQGYRTQLRYSYCRPMPQGEEELIKSENRGVRGKIHKSYSLGYTCHLEHDAYALFSLIKPLYRRKKIPLHLLPYLEDLVEASLQQSMAILPSIYSAEGELLASAFVPHCRSRAYLIANAATSAVEHKYAATFLLHNAILQSSHLPGLTFFDFEGSMLPEIESVFRALGGYQYSYLQLSRGRFSLWNRLKLHLYYSPLCHAHR